MNTQTRKDLTRTVASLAAYAVIGCIVAGAGWVCLSIIVNVAHMVTGG